jgi:hypothetical protein
MEIKLGSRWWTSNGEHFIVLATPTIDGNDWVYYRSEKPINEEVREYSCYKESFLSRFSPLPE